MTAIRVVGQTSNVGGEHEISFYEVPQEQWATFCDSFTRDHHGERVTVEVLQPFPDGRPPESRGEQDPRVEVLARDAALRTIFFDHGEETHDTPMVAISVVPESGRPAAHVVLAPMRITFEQPKDNHRLLRIETANHMSTLLHMQGEAIPGMFV